MPYFDELNSFLTRYQHHVAEYDKAKWELNVEQRILHGINHIPTKSAKLQSELIDLDLVRGSSFPKAKPKHGLFTVTRHALLRFIFLPFYHDWWSAQTSPRLFAVFLSLYCAQIINILLHLNLFPTSWGQLLDANSTTVNSTSGSTSSHQEEAINLGRIYGPSNIQDNGHTIISEIQTSEILSPIVLMIVLTILHSQIVATHGSKTEGPSGTKTRGYKQRRNSGSGYCGKHKNKRRVSRHSLRRRSNTKSSGPTSTSLSRLEASREQPLSPNGSKKVFFEDESKSWTSSNSDKDEGIVDEGQENQESGENENDGGRGIGVRRKNSKDIRELIDKNIIETNINATIRKFAEEEALAMASLQNEMPSQKKEDLELVVSNGEILHPAAVSFPPRSNLRKRNPSKVSEVSTSCADCSSNNNDSSSEDEFREATMMDEELRSKSEWTAVTTNSEDDDYEEENINSEDDDEMTETQLHDHPFAWEFQKYDSKIVFVKHPLKTISPSCASSDKVSCTIWDGSDAMKADLTVLDISSTIIAKVECAKENSDYLYLGIFFSFIVAFLPSLWRMNSAVDIDEFQVGKLGIYFKGIFSCVCGDELKSQIIIVISIMQRLCLALCVFFLLAVAEKTYKQRFLYAKLFSRLTSSRKARKSGIPHFRLNKVRNIKTWLSIRSYLQRRGPQRSVDTIVSGTFIATLFLIFFLSVELLKDSNRMYHLYNLEVVGWSLCLGFYLMRFMTLGSRISQKYRNLSVIITEQLNLYLKMEQKPHKKEELLVANNVLKLASELLKELEDPFKISSFASNPYLYNVTRLFILSAFSGVLSEMLGFKLKLYKIKIK